MRFIVDECTGPAVAAWLRSQSHDVFSVFEESRGLSDDAVLRKAFSEDRKWPHHGLILLRLHNERAASKIAAIERLLDAYSDRVHDSFVVVMESQVRFGPSEGQP